MSSNAIAIYEKVDDPVGFCTSMAKTCAAAAGVPIEQGEAVALVCLCENITPYEYRRRYHTTPFGPAMRADAMRAEFRMNHGGRYVISESSPEVADILFTDRDGNEYRSIITWEQAQKEPWPWAKGKGPFGSSDPKDYVASPANLKDNWAAPLSRQNMLLARATSRGLRAFCPELVAGIYTPEEMDDIAPAAPTVVIDKPQRITAADLLAQQTIATNGNGHASGVADGEEIDAEFTITADSTEASTTVAEAAPEAEATPGTATAAQRAELDALIEALKMPKAEQDRMLARRNVNSTRSLSKEQAAEIIAKLRDKARVETSAKN